MLFIIVSYYSWYCIYNKGCDNLPNIDNAVMHITTGVAGEWSYNSSVTYTCDIRYYLTSSLPVMCLIDGSWNGTPPTCDPVTCSPPLTPTNGSYFPVKTSYNFTDVVQFSCLHGFDHIGPNSSYCNFTDQWSADSPICQIKDCGNLPHPTNGKVWHTGGSTVGQTATYNCSDGYTRTGSASRTCNVSGYWTSEAPTCDLIRKFYIHNY